MKKLLVLLAMVGLVFSCRLVDPVEIEGSRAALPITLALGETTAEYSMVGIKYFYVSGLDADTLYSVTIDSMTGSADYWDLNSIYVFQNVEDAQSVENEVTLIVIDEGDLLDGGLVQLERTDKKSVAYFTGVTEAWIRVRGGGDAVPADVFTLKVEADAPALTPYFDFETSILYVPNADGTGYDEVYLTVITVDDDDNILITLGDDTKVTIEPDGTVTVDRPFGRSPEMPITLTLGEAKDVTFPTTGSAGDRFFRITGLTEGSVYELTIDGMPITVEPNWALNSAIAAESVKKMNTWINDSEAIKADTLLTWTEGDGGDLYPDDQTLVQDTQDDTTTKGRFTATATGEVMIRIRPATGAADDLNWTVTVSAVD